MRAERAINLGMRALTLGAKFLLLFFMAKYLEPVDVATYGLLYATVAYSIYFLGFDFYSFTTRELIREKDDERGHIVKQQLVLFGFSYLVFLALSWPLFALDFLPWRLYPWFLVLLVVEHLGQELYRLLVALQDQLMAGVLLFLRTGLWTLLAATLIYGDSNLRHVETIFWCWLGGGGLALLGGIYRVAMKGLGGWGRPSSWRWVRRGLRTAAPLLVATLAVRAILTVDRYWIEMLANAEVLAAYVFFIGLANALMSLLESGVFVFGYPALVQSAQQGDFVGFRHELSRLRFHALLVIFAFVLGTWITLGPLLDWVGRSSYADYVILFPCVLAAITLFAIAMVPHYALYALGADRHIIFSHMSALLIFLFLGYLMSPFLGFLAVPVGMMVAFLAVFAWKQSVYHCILRPAEMRKGMSRK